MNYQYNLIYIFNMNETNDDTVDLEKNIFIFYKNIILLQ